MVCFSKFIHSSDRNFISVSIKVTLKALKLGFCLELTSTFEKNLRFWKKKSYDDIKI